MQTFCWAIPVYWFVNVLQYLTAIICLEPTVKLRDGSVINQNGDFLGLFFLQNAYKSKWEDFYRIILGL